jgi:RimJ/RimL family protein N-acetyltransferase
VIRALAERAREAGNEDIWIFCDAWNKASAVGIGKAGFELAAKLRKIVWFGRVVNRAVIHVATPYARTVTDNCKASKKDL